MPMLKTKVCHISSLHPEKDHRIFFKECASLSKAGYNTHLILCNRRAFNELDIEVHNLTFEYTNRIDRIKKSLVYILGKAIEIDAEIYHLHDPELLMIAKRLKKLGKQVIYDAHEDVPIQILGKPYIPKWLRKPIARIYRSFEANICKQIDATVVASPSMLPRFESYNRAVGLFNFPQWRRAESVDWNSRERAICYVGTLTENRGLYNILEAIKDLDLTFYVAGNWHSKSFEQKCMAHPAWSKVEFLGYIDQVQLYALLSRVKIGLSMLHPLPNYKQAYTGKMFEYMAAGIPVLVSDFELWNQVVDQASCGQTCPPLDTVALSSCIQTMLDNDQQSDLQGKNGKQAARDHYNWSSQEKKLYELYHSLLNTTDEMA